MKPGIYYDMPAVTYHADPADVPSLSCSLAQLLLDGTPKRAQWSHPRLGPARERRATELMDEGTILHTLITGSGTECRECDFSDWRTKAAKEARAEARSAGFIPVLAERAAELRHIAAHARAEILTFPEIAACLSESARSEVTMIWEDEGPAICRARCDRIIPGTGIWDFKFTSRVDPLHDWDRKMVANGYDLRAAFYTRGHTSLFGHAVPYVYVIVETTPPFDVLALQCTPEMLALGAEKADMAIGLWNECSNNGEWPGYPRRILHVGPPVWAASKWAERQSLAQFEPGGSRVPAPPPARPFNADFYFQDTLGG